LLHHSFAFVVVIRHGHDFVVRLLNNQGFLFYFGCRKQLSHKSNIAFSIGHGLMWNILLWNWFWHLYTIYTTGYCNTLATSTRVCPIICSFWRLLQFNKWYILKYFITFLIFLQKNIFQNYFFLLKTSTFLIIIHHPST
jgi:hypothetical protein